VTRTYRLGKRADSQAATRQRILEAATALYEERGMAGTSMLAVATAADVAPGTVRHHFADPQDLAAAVGEALLAEMALPDPSIFAGIGSMAARIERLAVELAALSERGDRWWFVMQREPELARIWSSLQTSFEAQFEALGRAALGPLGTDDEAYAVVATVVGPPTFYALRSRGCDSATARRIGLELVVPWLERRARAARAGSAR
jgi:AcrR family transcriptional regulator